MAVRRRTILWLVVSGLIVWNFFFIVRISLNARHSASSEAAEAAADASNAAALRRRLEKLRGELHSQLHLHARLLDLLRKEGGRLGDDIVRRVNALGDAKEPLRLVKTSPARRRLGRDRGIDARASSVPLPVLVMACNRETVTRSLNSLLRYRPSAQRHPIIVSQDCGHPGTAARIDAYGPRVTHLRQPNLAGFSLPVAQKRFEGYYKISRHYKWALDQVFLVRNYSAAIVVEDDLEVAPDFFEYFQATYAVLRNDSSLMCVSAWNDNGKAHLIADDAALLHRTDFFPGLGWMLLRSLWLEIRAKWPPAFWDEYMRRPEVRRDRACIRPEVSRTLTFGRTGVSNGQYYDKHLRFIRLNKRFVAFTQRDMAYLNRSAYDPNFEVEVYTKPERRIDEGLSNNLGPVSGPVRVTYDSREQFRSIAHQLGIMDDFKAGVPRTAYRGVVSVVYRGRRVYVAPRRPWAGYNLNWK